MNPIPFARLGRRLDRLGAAFGWGTPAATNLEGLDALEFFYRWQCTPVLQITPGVQLLITPAYNDDYPLIMTFGGRPRIAL